MFTGRNACLHGEPAPFWRSSCRPLRRSASVRPIGSSHAVPAGVARLLHFGRQSITKLPVNSINVAPEPIYGSSTLASGVYRKTCLAALEHRRRRRESTRHRRVIDTFAIPQLACRRVRKLTRHAADWGGRIRKSRVRDTSNICGRETGVFYFADAVDDAFLPPGRAKKFPIDRRRYVLCGAPFSALEHSGRQGRAR